MNRQLKASELEAKSAEIVQLENQEGKRMKERKRGTGGMAL